MSFGRRVAGAYADIWHTYWAWLPSLLILAALVFVPLGLLDALVVNVDVDSLDLSSGVEIATAAVAVAAITATGLLGEVFFSGAIALSLTHPRGERRPSLREIAGRVEYRRLIVVDIAFVVIVAAGVAVAAVPGVLAFVFLSLAGVAVEVEHHTAAGALARSAQLVRGSFWFAFWVIVPIEIAGEAVGHAVTALVQGLLGHAFLGEWMAEALSNVVLSPVFAVGAVLLAVELIAEKEGTAPPLHSVPVPA